MDLRAVVLYAPGRELDSIRNPKAVQHSRKVNRVKLARELRALAATFRKNGVAVRWLEPSRLPKGQSKIPPNLVFMRDLFFNTPHGAVMARMA
jgi:N-dimethylarginine dimethylaminohydrolase